MKRSVPLKSVRVSPRTMAGAVAAGEGVCAGGSVGASLGVAVAAGGSVGTVVGVAGAVGLVSTTVGVGGTSAVVEPHAIAPNNSATLTIR
jgi:hypothetical protein